MKKRILVVGSVGASVILVLAMMTTVVSAQIIKSDEQRISFIQCIKDKIIKNNWVSTGIIDDFIVLIFAFFFFLKLFLEGNIFF